MEKSNLLLIATASLLLFTCHNSLFGEEKKGATAATEIFDFGANDSFAKWKAAGHEATVSTSKVNGIPVLVFKVKVDLFRDAKGNPKGKYLAGWPRIYIYLKPELEVNFRSNIKPKAV